MEFFVILLIPNGLNIGFYYFPPTEEYDFEEISVYLLIVQLKWRFYNE
tara:strand:+ start:460 stop:603 length:144 start_codon:yes stop_codon:yes gene_type:complete